MLSATLAVLPLSAAAAADASPRYLFFLHGGIVEDGGLRPTSPRYGVYEYEKIVETLRGNGLVVVSEARAKGTDSRLYASRVAAQIRELLGRGVAPSHITVLGASKGAVIAMLASTQLRSRDLRFVLMANCNDWVLDRFAIDLWGDVLSICDTADEIGQSCRSEEIRLTLGIGHAILYRPLEEWVRPTVDWAKR